MTDEFDEFDTGAEEIDRVIDEGRPVRFADWHLGCDHGPEVTHSPYTRIRVVSMTWARA